MQRTRDPVVERKCQEPPDLVGEHQRLTVLGKGDEAYRPHALPPSRRWALPTGADRLGARAPETQLPGCVSPTPYADRSPNGGKPRRGLVDLR
ncbi:hypothetical protein KRMM14A1004_55710 [Krasilnikovia sp. MM14-A1004]